ncbi:hypothetical protein A2U01_0037874 [Trifolium medium]|uniref:Uncharacterized protein n=1 Tax=Trifolium medium TaxID=97028 RepID=A0A392PZ42_9FABA|nr:hypothetical protein [Trifolium medium]
MRAAPAPVARRAGIRRKLPQQQYHARRASPSCAPHRRQKNNCLSQLELRVA